jgi:excisionase family DNA binding protein
MHRDESRLAVGMAEAALRLGLSARTIANLIRRNELPSRKVGRRRIIPVAALEAFVVGEHPTSDGAGCTETHGQRR